jgi:predicted ATP-dependent serine protease
MFKCTNCFHLSKRLVNGKCESCKNENVIVMKTKQNTLCSHGEKKNVGKNY